MTTVYDETTLFGPAAQPKAGVNDIYTPHSTKYWRLGTRYVAGDGRTFHYARANATTALIAGDLIQSATAGSGTTEQQDMTIGTASAAGDNFGYATVKTDTVAANHFEDGWYCVSDGTAAQGGGQLYQIKSHPASAAASTKFTFYDNIKVLISTSAKAGVIQNIYDDVIQTPATTETGVVVGVAPVAVTAAYYFWVQTWGVCNVLIKTAMTPGASVIQDVETAGSAGISGGSEIEAVLGFGISTVDTTDWGFVYLQIAP